MGTEPVDNIIKDLKLEDIFEDLEYLSITWGVEIITVIKYLINVGAKTEAARLEVLRFPPHTPPFKNNININNNNEVVINKLTLKDLTKSNPIVTGKSPLEKKAERKKNRKPKNKTLIPAEWRASREVDTIADEKLIDYCEKHGYDWYAAKELFLSFVDYHMARGSKFVKWENAFYTWVRNDTKFNGSPAKKTGNVVGLYKNSDPMKELFDDRS